MLYEEQSDVISAQNNRSNRSWEKHCKRFLRRKFFLSYFIGQFINVAVGEEAVSVGHDLNSWTRESKHVVCPHPKLASKSSRRVILVDTPGLNNENREDSDILVHIADWMKVT
jgi:hypothetical protein